MLTHSGWCHCSDLIRKGNDLQQPYKQGSAASVKPQPGVFKAWALLSWWHLVTSIAPSQTATWLETIQQEIKLDEKGYSGSQGRLASSFLLNCWWQTALFPHGFLSFPKNHPLLFAFVDLSCVAFYKCFTIHWSMFWLQLCFARKETADNPRRACGAKTELQVGSIAYADGFGTVGLSGGMQVFPSAIFGVEGKDINTSASSQCALIQRLSVLVGERTWGILQCSLASHCWAPWGC